ncbi:MAG: cytochrome c [Chloroflexi bacterium]|nr:cytochrome c [Chloroflexota bacterium]MCL5275608.1 cytochrome c [Chloroflexota bacterium]
MKRRLEIVTGMCAAVAVLAMAACGSAPTPTATTAPVATSAPAATATTAATATSAPAATATTAATATGAPTAAATATTEPTATAADAGATATSEPAQPSNAGGPGKAIDLTGDAKAGATIYVDNCKKCHGDEGKGGISNPGSSDGTIPPLNPIDDTLVNKDPKVFATNLDLFVEHGSTPEGSNPKQKMTAFGDEKKLTPQQIADVIAYVISLNSK